MADIIELIFTWITTFPNYLFIVAIIIGYILYTFWSKRRRLEEIFELEDFRESAYVSTEKLLDRFGINIDAYLTKGIEPLGKITKFFNFKGEIQYEVPKQLLDKKIETNKLNLWILRLGKKGILDIIFGNDPFDYLIVDDEHIEPYDGTRKRWAIKENVSFTPYANCYVTSTEGVAYLNDISFRRAQEEILTHTQNFPRKVAYLELKQAKVMERYQAQIEKSSAQYDKYKKDVLASGKDIEEEEEE
jgi:hypothetical protein